LNTSCWTWMVASVVFLMLSNNCSIVADPSYNRPG
jgi:hypothetical protein